MDNAPPRPAPRRAAEALTGQHLGNGAARQTAEGRPHVGVAIFGGDAILSVDAEGGSKTLALGARPLGGLYAAGPGRLLALEFGGARVFDLRLQGPHLALTDERALCDAPRLMVLEPAGRRAFVLCRDPARPLIRLDLDTLDPLAVDLPGDTPADIALDAAGAWLWSANLGSDDLTPVSTASLRAEGRIAVSPGPWKIVALPGGQGHRMLVLHANSPLATLVDGPKGAPLPPKALSAIPSHVVASSAEGGPVFALYAGAGRLEALDPQELRPLDAIDVPVKSADLVWSDPVGKGRLLISTGEGGQMWVVDWLDGRLQVAARVPLDAAAGRIYPGKGAEGVWVTGPQAGRVARYEID